MQGRFEYKYLISSRTAELLRRVLRGLMTPDPHGDAEGRYFIRSLYFDDADDTAFTDKRSGIARRVKYRIRFYNMDASHLLLEAKRKNGVRVYKDALRIDRSTAEALLAGRAPEEGLADPLLAEFAAVRSARVLRPQIIVDYDRAAFRHPVSNTRVTLDTHVCSGLHTEGFFGRIPSCPVMDAAEGILELKYDRFLPPHIADILSQAPKVLLANSKYCQCMALKDF